MLLFFFFFKQKTAYEMRISDWSSDVCSSDLQRFDDAGGKRARRLDGDALGDRVARGRQVAAAHLAVHRGVELCLNADELDIRLQRLGGNADAGDKAAARSEEHTSELQSLMRISYAVFCLKKKKK